MDRYSRLLLAVCSCNGTWSRQCRGLRFQHSADTDHPRIAKRDVDDAIEQVVNSVHDWSGGTRIGEAIKTFNFEWSRRVLRSGATVVMISDGWDRGDPQLLST